MISPKKKNEIDGGTGCNFKSPVRCRSVNTTLLLRPFWIKNCLPSFPKTFIAEHLRNRWEIVSISRWQKQHLSDCLRLIFFKKSLEAILRCKNLKWKVLNLEVAVQLKAIVYASFQSVSRTFSSWKSLSHFSWLSMGVEVLFFSSDL